MAISIAEAAQRLVEAGLAMAGRYERGTTGVGGKWFSAASKAEDNFKVGMSAALARGAFGKGIQEAGASSYDEGVRSKGVMNWPTGMQAAGPKYQRKIQKFSGLWGAALPTPRGARGSANNLKRMSENVDRFMKTAGK
jgi:hypothetical protein